MVRCDDFSTAAVVTSRDSCEKLSPTGDDWSQAVVTGTSLDGMLSPFFRALHVNADDVATLTDASSTRVSDFLASVCRCRDLTSLRLLLSNCPYATADSTVDDVPTPNHFTTTLFLSPELVASDEDAPISELGSISTERVSVTLCLLSVTSSLAFTTSTVDSACAVLDDALLALAVASLLELVFTLLREL